MLISTALVTVSALYGLGQRHDEIESVDAVINAAFYGVLSQSFAAFSLAIAKWSLGLFLLRIVEMKIYKFLIWFILTALTLTTVLWITLFWLQCEPFEFLYNRTIPGGQCVIPFLGVSIVHACKCS